MYGLYLVSDQYVQHDVLHKHIAGRRIRAEQVDAVPSTVDQVSRVQRKLSYR